MKIDRKLRFKKMNRENWIFLIFKYITKATKQKYWNIMLPTPSDEATCYKHARDRGWLNGIGNASYTNKNIMGWGIPCFMGSAIHVKSNRHHEILIIKIKHLVACKKVFCCIMSFSCISLPSQKLKFHSLHWFYGNQKQWSK